MSQHRYETRLADGTPVTVTAGWDRPLGWLYLNIEGPLDDPRSDEDGFFYSNLHDVRAPTTDWSYFVGKLSAYGIVLPEMMTAAIARDMANNVGNHEVNWSSAAGS